MKFVYTSPEEAKDEIAETINESLEYGSVLLLVSGGSNIQLAVDVRQKLKLSNRLTVGLIDERFGPVGHKDSNWQQLLNARLNTKHLHLLPVLTDSNMPVANTAHEYSQKLREAISSHDTIIGIFGIGTDGHTAGILPGSPAVDSHDVVAYFKGPDYERITTTPELFPLLNHAFLVSYHEKKHEQLRLLQSELPIADQPAQALKRISNLIIYTDFQSISGAQ